jgi:cell division protein FtsL
MKDMVIIAVLVPLVLSSALGVVFAKHQSRKLFVQLNELQQQRDAMNVQWGQLQLELSTWATNGRIEQVARKRLRMTNVDFDQVVIVRP